MHNPSLSAQLLDSGFRRNDKQEICASHVDLVPPSFRRKPESSNGGSNNVVVQIAPLRIAKLDEFKFPGAAPFLDGLFALNCRLDRHMRFEPDQAMNTIFLCKPLHKVVFVLPNALYEVRRYARVKRTVSAAGEDIHAGLFHQRSLLDSGFRRNDNNVLQHPRHSGESDRRKCRARNPATADQTLTGRSKKG